MASSAQEHTIHVKLVLCVINTWYALTAQLEIFICNYLCYVMTDLFDISPISHFGH